MTNVGEKIKKLIIIEVIIGLLVCVVLFFVGNAAYNEDKDYIEYATVYGGAYGYPSLQSAGDNAYNGLQMRNIALILAPCLLVGMLPLYGYGTIVENSEMQMEYFSMVLEEQKKTNKCLERIRQMSAGTSDDSKNAKK